MLGFGSEMIEGLRLSAVVVEARKSMGALEAAESFDWPMEWVGNCKDAGGRVRESFFIFRRDCGLGMGGGKMKESVSEVVEERVETEAELSLCTRWRSGF